MRCIEPLSSMPLALLMKWFLAGFWGPLGLWVSVLLIATAWAFGKRIMRG